MSYTRVQELKQQIANTTDETLLVSLYEELVPLLNEPRKRRKDMTPEERAQHRAEVRARRAAGIYLRGGRQMTPEEIEKLKASWTPERRAAASAKAKGRKATPDTLAKIKEAAEARKARNAAKEARLAELEAMLAEGKIGSTNGDETGKRQKR